MIVYFSCGRVMEKNCRTRPAPSITAASYIDRRDLADGALVDQRVEGDELPGHDEDHRGHGQMGSPSQSWARIGRCSPAPRPKLGSSRALKVIAIAAELSSRGMKYSTANTSR